MILFYELVKIIFTNHVLLKVIQFLQRNELFILSKN